MTGMCSCNNDDNTSSSSSILPFTLIALIPDRNDDANAHLQGYWSSGDEIVALNTDYSGMEKSVLTLQSGGTFSGSISTLTDNGDEIAFLYPASAYTASSSDTLTQMIWLDGQDGTANNLASYDYLWGIVETSLDESYTAACEMQALTSVGKFAFKDESGQALQGISQILITSLSGKILSAGLLDLEDGAFNDSVAGSLTVKNANGISDVAYITFFAGEAQPHFTLTTLQGDVYETTSDEILTWKKGSVSEVKILTCTPLEKARIGDYYYSDGTWSSERRTDKTCVGIVFALTDNAGNIDRSLASSAHGRIVALADNQTSITWGSSKDVEGLSNHSYVQDTLTVSSLPYYKGILENSYFTEESEKQLTSISIGTDGRITSWMTEGVLTDFDGKRNTSYIRSGTSTFPAGTYCDRYSNGISGWYLPATGELALIYALQQTGILCNAIYDCYTDLQPYGYWTSSECSESNAWYINFLSGNVACNSKKSTYRTRPVAQF